MKKHNPKSEAALKTAVEKWDEISVMADASRPEIIICETRTQKTVAIINVKDLIKRRAPLTGITKRLKAAVRTPKRTAKKR